ncbi:MAG: 50S ribosomal protein L14, partial [Candidatus Woesebacteria bacterium GW2011_GWA2_40_7]
MVQLRTMLVSADNSGAKRLMIIGVPGRVGKFASLGDVVLCVVKGADAAGVVADH